jgi:hypothetical protein
MEKIKMEIVGRIPMLNKSVYEVLFRGYSPQQQPHINSPSWLSDCKQLLRNPHITIIIIIIIIVIIQTPVDWLGQWGTVSISCQYLQETSQHLQCKTTVLAVILSQFMLW